MERLQDEVSRTLLTLEKSELITVCEHLKCSEPGGGFASQARRSLIRLAEETLDHIQEEDDSSFQQYLQHLLSLVATLKQADPRMLAAKSDETSELDILKEKYDKLQQEQNEARRVLAREIGALEEKLRTKTQAEDPRTSTLPEVTLRRDFRICGQIGEAGQKDKLSYTSLINQMESGQRKGHSETEIVEAVTRAISPGLHLREMLEIKRGLTLSTLKTILRGHFKVDSSSDLLHRLMNISQDPKESAQNFLFRAIELKEKLIWKVGEEEESEKFSPELIQRKFLRSVETGLLSDAVKFQLKPYLSSVVVTDEVLIEQISEAANLEQERQQKLRKAVVNRPPRLNTVQTDLPFSLRQEVEENAEQRDMDNKGDKIKSRKNVGPSPEKDTNSSQLLEGLKAEVQEMKKIVLETVEARRTNLTSPAATQRRPRGCRACQQVQMGESCRHCYKCGQEGHLSRGCRRNREQQGNWRGLLSEDPQ